MQQHSETGAFASSGAPVLKFLPFPPCVHYMNMLKVIYNSASVLNECILRNAFPRACSNNTPDMKKPNNLPIRPALRGLVLALAVSALSGYVAQAHPYASGITNNGGTISFILNETADTVGVYFPTTTPPTSSAPTWPQACTPSRWGPGRTITLSRSQRLAPVPYPRSAWIEPICQLLGATRCGRQPERQDR